MSAQIIILDDNGFMVDCWLNFRTWCYNELEGPASYRAEMKKCKISYAAGNSRIIEFETSSDATAFILKWGSNGV